MDADRIAQLSSGVVRDIVRKLVEAHGDLGQALTTLKGTLRNVARGNKALCEAARSEMWYVLSLAPTRVLTTTDMLFFMSGKHADSAAQGLIHAARSSSSALMPRISDLARDARSDVVEELGAKLMRSMKTATVNGSPMYGADDAVLRQLAQEVMRKLKTGPYPKLGGKDGYDRLGHDMDRFLALTAKERVDRIHEHGPLCIWDVSNVTSLENACSSTPKEPKKRRTFNSDLFWDTARVDTMIRTFEGNSEFRGDLSTWDVRKVQNMDRMFSMSGLVDSGIRNWDLANLVHAERMFEGAPLSRALDLSRWRMPKVRFLACMFLDSGIVDSGVGKWTLPVYTHTRGMFERTHFVGSITKWTGVQKAEALKGVLSGTKYGSSGARIPPSTLDPRCIEDAFANALVAKENEENESACTVS
jgi:surface protein